MAIKGRPIIIIDRYTWVQIARYPSVKEASRDLSIPSATIYQCLCKKVASYEAYFIYENEYSKWFPSERLFVRTRGLKTSKKLEELRQQSEKVEL